MCIPVLNQGPIFLPWIVLLKVFFRFFVGFEIKSIFSIKLISYLCLPEYPEKKVLFSFKFLTPNAILLWGDRK